MDLQQSSKHSPSTQQQQHQHGNCYFGRNTSWAQDQPAGQQDAQQDAHVPWSLMDFYFATQQDERCASTSSQNDELSTEGPSTNSNVNRLDETCTQASPGYTSTPSSDIRGPFSRFAAVSNPALLTPPIASNFTVRIKEKKKEKTPLSEMYLQT